MSKRHAMYLFSDYVCTCEEEQDRGYTLTSCLNTLTFRIFLIVHCNRFL